MQPVLQQSGRPGDGDKEAGGHGGQQGGRQHPQGKAGAQTQEGQGRQGNAGDQRQEAVSALELFGGTGLIVGVQEVVHVAFSPQQHGAIQIVPLFDDAVQPDGPAQSIHLGHFRGPAVEPGQQRKGHLQGESGAAGHPELLQAEDRIRAAGQKGKHQHKVDGKFSVEQVRDTVQHLVAAQQGGHQHA